MLTPQQQFDAIVRALEKIVGRTLTPAEKTIIQGHYNALGGTQTQQAIETIRRSMGWTPEELRQFRASSDNNDRIFRELEGLLGK